MTRTKVIKLRTAAETQQDGITKLQQFNPSFFLVGKNAITCRAPGCNETTPRLKPSGDLQHIKQDLFLCEIHRTKLANLVSKRCEEENIIVSVASYKHEDFDGYTYLIGELEKAFTHLVKKPHTLNMPQNSVYPNSNLVLAEVFLNARNFLTITHALLNPNGDNIGVVLPAWFAMFDGIMNHLSQPELLERLVSIVIVSVTRFFQGKLPHPVSKITIFGLKLPRCHIFAIFPNFSQFFHIFFLIFPKNVCERGGGGANYHGSSEITVKLP